MLSILSLIKGAVGSVTTAISVVKAALHWTFGPAKVSLPGWLSPEDIKKIVVAALMFLSMALLLVSTILTDIGHGGAYLAAGLATVANTISRWFAAAQPSPAPVVTIVAPAAPTVVTEIPKA